MLNFKTLSLKDKDVFDKFIKPYYFSTCEYSFTNLLIWKNGCKIEYCIEDNTLIIKKIDFDGHSHFMQPIKYKKENLKRIVDELIEYKNFHKLDCLFKDAEKPFIDDLKDVYGDKFTILEDRNNYDYIYKSENLINLSGKKLHGKKNHYNHFIKNYNYEIKFIKSDSKDIVEDCIDFAQKWYDNSGHDKKYLLYELDGIKYILTNISFIDYTGIAVYIDDRIKAFTIGEKVNEKMAVIHIEKADPSINGLYTFINQKFIEICFNDVPFINREQDLGLEGLRKAKLSYHPVKLEKKYSVI